MPYDVSKYHAPLECFIVADGVFTPEEIDKIIFLEDLQKFDKGQVGIGGPLNSDTKVRDSDVSWLHVDENSQWIFDRLGWITSRVNFDHFMYNIRGIEAIQYTKYGPDQHYTWHWDVEFGWQNYIRKISLVMLLTDPDEYEGGEFEIIRNGNLDDVCSFKPKKGDVVCFASWMPHRVAPVTSGTRKSLVAWVMGEREH